MFVEKYGSRAICLSNQRFFGLTYGTIIQAQYAPVKLGSYGYRNNAFKNPKPIKLNEKLSTSSLTFYVVYFTPHIDVLLFLLTSSGLCVDSQSIN